MSVASGSGCSYGHHCQCGFLIDPALRAGLEESNLGNSRMRAAVLAVGAGMGTNFLGDWVLGVRLEIFQGMATFTPRWMLDVFLVNFVVGLVVARFYGRHAKWLAIVPPFLVRCISYAYLYFVENPVGDFFFQLHLHYWGPTVILAVECANIGGILGEVLMGVYSRKGRSAGEGNAGHLSVLPESENGASPENGVRAQELA
jgi:hypothetical protein